MHRKFTVVINDREAIPVRAVPYKTMERLSTDLLADKLSRRNKMSVDMLSNIYAYGLDGNAIKKVEPGQWDAVHVHLKALTSKLMKNLDGGDEGYSVWLRESVRELPASTFLWLDEFLEGIPVTNGTLIGNVMLNWHLANTHFLNQQDFEVVFEGFESYIEKQREDELAGWWFASMDAAAWWNQDSVNYKDAAKLLFGVNPREVERMRAQGRVVHDAEELLSVGDDTSTGGKYRCLKQEDYLRLRDAFDANLHTSQDR